MGRSYGGSFPLGSTNDLVREHAHRLVAFVFSGVAGVITTFGGTVLLYRDVHLALWFASALSIQTAILVTFTINASVTWRDRRNRGLVQLFLVFEAVSLVGMGINEAGLLTSVDAFHLYYLLGLVIGSGLAAVWNYLANHNVTFAAR